jgi:mannose-1-phosphate guanylyltransferase
MSDYSGIILVGGDGTRLSALTRRLAGDERPKQFCRLIGDETLLEQRIAARDS